MFHFFAVVFLLLAASSDFKNAFRSSMQLEKLGLSAGRGAQHLRMSLAMAGGIWPSLSPMETRGEVVVVVVAAAVAAAAVAAAAVAAVVAAASPSLPSSSPSSSPRGSVAPPKPTAPTTPTGETSAQGSSPVQSSQRTTPVFVGSSGC